MTSLSPGDEDLHDPDNPELHVWWPPYPYDEDADRAWIARVSAHVNTHNAKDSAPVIDEELETEQS